jgi:hypothetical protein
LASHCGNHGYRLLDQLGRKCWQAIVSIFGPTIGPFR